jgi:hypothetical protein
MSSPTLLPTTENPRDEGHRERSELDRARLDAMPDRFAALLVSALLLGACAGQPALSEDGSDGTVASTQDAGPGTSALAPALSPETATPAPAADVSPSPAPVSEPVAAPEAVATPVSFDLPGCPDAERGAVADKAQQRYWLCRDGVAITDEIPMTTASDGYGLPPVGTYPVFARDENAFGIHGEPLERFVAFYTTSKGNRIAFHEVVNQDPATVGDLDQRGASAGCFRVREADSIAVWEFLRLDDPVVVIS